MSLKEYKNTPGNSEKKEHGTYTTYSKVQLNNKSTEDVMYVTFTTVMEI
jgi:hypothetical protein